MCVHVFVCHLANRLISSYYSNMPGPAATVNNTVRRYESLIKMDVTHSSKADNSNQNSVQFPYLNSPTTSAHTHTHTHARYKNSLTLKQSMCDSFVSYVQNIADNNNNNSKSI